MNRECQQRNKEPLASMQVAQERRSRVLNLTNTNGKPEFDLVPQNTSAIIHQTELGGGMKRVMTCSPCRFSAVTCWGSY